MNTGALHTEHVSALTRVDWQVKWTPDSVSVSVKGSGDMRVASGNNHRIFGNVKGGKESAISNRMVGSSSVIQLLNIPVACCSKHCLFCVLSHIAYTKSELLWILSWRSSQLF